MKIKFNLRCVVLISDSGERRLCGVAMVNFTASEPATWDQ